MKFIYNDGGRLQAGYRGNTGDCAVRAISIATEISYQQVYDAINLLAKDERVTKRMRRRSNSRTGTYRKTTDKYLKSLNWVWHPTMYIGAGCKVHLRADELPTGRLIVRVSRHWVAMIDGIVYDTHDCSRDGTRCVYGYWSKS